jgi:FKBP-type peptidyl-prolyl cis-trans isomerase FkpA
MRLVGCFVLLGLSLAGCGGDNGGTPTSPSPAPTINVGFSATDLRVGSGAEATTGRNASVRYTLWAYSTTAADNKGSQIESGTFNFVVGQGVVPGFSMGVNGMRVGGLRRVVIPPNLGYGNNPPDTRIRPNETLLFEIELLAVQ